MLEVIRVRCATQGVVGACEDIPEYTKLIARELQSSSTQLLMIICRPGKVTPGHDAGSVEPKDVVSDRRQYTALATAPPEPKDRAPKLCIC